MLIGYAFSTLERWLLIFHVSVMYNMCKNAMNVSENV